MSKTRGGIFLSLFLVVLTPTAQNKKWNQVFNGKNLSGWKQVGGIAKLYSDEAMILGEATYLLILIMVVLYTLL